MEVAVMTAAKARQIVLAARPQGRPKPSDFRLEETEIPMPSAGQVLLRVQYLSLDPYMRGRMDDRKSYATPVPLGSLVGQRGEVAGERAVSIAGGPEKCAYVKDELRFDAAIDHRDTEFAAKLAAACPDGIDVYFENVGGAIWQAVLPLLNKFARVPVSGLIAQYNGVGKGDGTDRLPATMRQILSKSLTVRGFLNNEFAAEHYPAFLREVGAGIADGRIRYREDFVDGLENAPEAFIGMLEGRNFGKLIVRVSA